MKQRHFIDSHKGATGLFIGCMFAFDAWDNTTICSSTLATHGLYGLLWIHKSRTFMTSSGATCGARSMAPIFGPAFSLYWLTPYLICSQQIEKRRLGCSPWVVSPCLASASSTTSPPTSKSTRHWPTAPV